jgi:hypothetical protein
MTIPRSFGEILRELTWSQTRILHRLTRAAAAKVSRTGTIQPISAGWMSEAMHRYEFDLEISPEEYLDYYRGVLKQVMVRCGSGETVQFPASLLQPFLLPDGVRGRFVLTCDEQFKHAHLQRAGSPP